jgi:peptidoglycan/xylan/chitin deacetylase (PgdA/CDA1 family)
MGKANRVQAIEIICIDSDNFGLFAKVQLTFFDEQLLIRWGLDETTYESLLSMLSSNPFSAYPTPPHGLRYFLVVDQEIHTGNESCADILCTSGLEETILCLPCTKLFACNLHWLQSVKHRRELEHLAFDAAPQLVPFASGAGKWRKRVILTSIASLLIFATGTSGVVMLHRIQSNQPSLFMKPVPRTSIHRSATSHGKITQSDVSSTEPFAPTTFPPVMNFSTTHSQSPHKQENAQTVSVPQVFEVPQGEVALTIDDGPSPYTEDLVRTLHKYGVVATFFFVGNRVQDWPNAVHDALANGDEIGDHSLSHPVLATLSLAKQRQQIVQGARDIQKYDPNAIRLFRPPYESFNQDTEEVLAQEHMALALWNRDPKDWAAKNGHEVAVRVIHGNPSGGVFDMHENPNTLAALPEIIKALKAQHLKFVTLTAPKGYTGIQPLSDNP